MLHIHVDHIFKRETAEPTYKRHYRRSISCNIIKTHNKKYQCILVNKNILTVFFQFTTQMVEF